MKTVNENIKYIEWLNAEDMHKASIGWISELKFIKDEQHFFEDLIKSYTLQLIDSQFFLESKEIIETLKKLEKKNKSLIKTIVIHENKLQVMVDGIDEPQKEEAYKNTHRELIISISRYLKDYRKLKTKLFDIIKSVMKREKQKYLLK